MLPHCISCLMHVATKLRGYVLSKKYVPSRKCVLQVDTCCDRVTRELQNLPNVTKGHQTVPNTKDAPQRITTKYNIKRSIQESRGRYTHEELVYKNQETFRTI